jgi:hypothetical protein
MCIIFSEIIKYIISLLEKKTEQTIKNDKDNNIKLNENDKDNNIKLNKNIDM